jgi:hypothetical protein
MNIPEQNLARPVCNRKHGDPHHLVDLDMVVQRLHMDYRYTWGGQYNVLAKGNKKRGSQLETFVLFARTRREKHTARPRLRALPADGCMDGWMNGYEGEFYK